MNKYNVTWCPICNQGWVKIVKDEKSGLLYLCCDECEAEWTNPDEIGVWGKGSRCRYGKIIIPTPEDIQSKGWEKYLQQNC